MAAARCQLQRLAAWRRTQIEHAIAGLGRQQAGGQAGGEILHPPGAFGKAGPFGDAALLRRADMAGGEADAFQRQRPMIGLRRVFQGQVGRRLFGQCGAGGFGNGHAPIARPEYIERAGQARRCRQGGRAADQAAEHAMHQPARPAFHQRQRCGHHGVRRRFQLQPAGQSDAQGVAGAGIDGERPRRRAVDQRVQFRQPAQHGQRQQPGQPTILRQRQIIGMAGGGIERGAAIQHRLNDFQRGAAGGNAGIIAIGCRAARAFRLAFGFAGLVHRPPLAANGGAFPPISVFQGNCRSP